MAKPKKNRKSDAEFLKDAEALLQVYPRIAAGLSKALDQKKFEEQVAALDGALKAVQVVEAQRKAAVAAKRADRKSVNTFMKRVRNGVKSHFGDDSIEYGLVGGVRLSERKHPVRKTKKEAA